MVLVDTSVWIEYLDRAHPAVADEMDRLVRTAKIATAGLVLAELRRGARSVAQVRMILEAIEPLDYFETDRATWLRAGEISAEAAARGHQLQVGDCLLAALALREGCPLYSLDRDFERIPGLKLYRSRAC